MQKRGYHDFSFKIFCLTVPKNFVGEHFGVSENFGYRKIICITEGGITFSVKNFLSHSTEKFRWGTLRCFRKFRVSQNFMHKKGISLNSVEKFLSHSSKKFRWGTLWCFRKFRVSQNFMHKKGISLNSVEKFLSHSSKKFRWGTLWCFRKFRVSQNFMHKKGISLNSVEKFLSHSADKIRRTLLCFERILVSKIFKQRRGEASRFCRNFFFSQDRKNFAREPFCVSENFW